MLQLDRMTTKEQFDTLTYALDLIKKPEHWCQGEWKCEIRAVDQFGYDKGVATDEQGRPLYKYCLEGAINQAVLDLYGYERAERLRAINTKDPDDYDNYDDEDGRDIIAVEDGITPAHIMSLDELAWKLYEEEFREKLPGVAMRFLEENDRTFAAMNWQDMEGRTHSEVLDFVRRKVTQLKRRLGK